MPKNLAKYPVYNQQDHGNVFDWIHDEVKILRARQNYEVAKNEVERKLRSERLRDVDLSDTDLGQIREQQ